MPDAHAAGVALGLRRQRVEIERQRVHLDALAGVGRRPRLARAVAVELDAQRVGIVEVERLGDEVVAGPAEGRALAGHAQQRRAELAARRVEEGGVEQARRALRRRAGRLALAQLEQVAHGRPDDGVVERRRAGRGPRRAGGRFGCAGRWRTCPQATRAWPARPRVVLADDVLGDRAQVGVQVAAEHVAQQRAQVARQLGGQRVELGVDRRGRR